MDIMKYWRYILPKSPDLFSMFSLTLDKSKDEPCLRDLKPYLHPNTARKFGQNQTKEGSSSFYTTHFDASDNAKGFFS